MRNFFWRFFLRINARAVFLLCLAALAGVMFWMSRSSASREGEGGADEPVGAESSGPGEIAPLDSIPPPKFHRNPLMSPALSRLVAEERARQQRLEAERQRAEEEARLKGEEEARLKAEEEARLLAEEARLKVEEEARLIAEEEARLKAEMEASLRAEEDALRMAAEAEQAATADAAAEVADAGAAAAAAPPPSPPPPPPGPPRARLVYRGTLTRTDGETHAVVENVTTHETGLYEVGDEIEGFRIEEFSRRQINLSEGTNAVHELAIGQLKVLALPK